MKTLLLFIIVILLGVIAYFLYEESQKSPMEKAADDMSEAIEGAAKEIEKVFEKKQ